MKTRNTSNVRTTKSAWNQQKSSSKILCFWPPLTMWVMNFLCSFAVPGTRPVQSMMMKADGSSPLTNRYLQTEHFYYILL